jgi:hypothetical protein
MKTGPRIPLVKQVRAEKKRLRTFIDAEPRDSVAKLFAYAMETALRWATEPTEGWDLIQEAMDLAKRFDELEG